VSVMESILTILQLISFQSGQSFVLVRPVQMLLTLLADIDVM